MRGIINGREARTLKGDLTQWEVELEVQPGADIEAAATDAAGNVERTPHRLRPPTP